MSESEIADMKDHLAIFLTVRSAVTRGTIPEFITEQTTQDAWSRVQAYIDAYDVQPTLKHNPVPRALTLLRHGDSDTHLDVATFLSESEWNIEKQAIEREYETDESFYPVIGDGK